MEIDLKLPVQMVQQLLELVRNTPAPHAITDPILRAIVAQAQPQIEAAQAPALPADAPAPSRQVRRASARKKA